MPAPSGITSGIGVDVYIVARRSAAAAPSAAIVKTPADPLITANLLDTVTDLGDYGSEANNIEFGVLGEGQTRKIAGQGGTTDLTLSFAFDGTVDLHETIVGWATGQRVEVFIRNRSGLAQGGTGNASCDYLQAQIGARSKSVGVDGPTTINLTLALEAEPQYIEGAT